MKSTLLLGFGLLIVWGCGLDNQTATTPPSTNSTENAPAAASKEKTIIDLASLGIAEHPENQLGGLSVGQLAPPFSGKDQNGEDFSLTSSLEKGPVVLIFYRGYWCGYCNRQLDAFAQELDQLRSKGVTVVAVSPESNEYAQKTAEKNGNAFALLSDSDQSIMQQYKVAFRVTADYQQKVKKYVEKDLTEMSGYAQATLPIPATYLIGQDGKVAYRFYDPNYRERASVQEILSLL
ncbi:MAG: peroxiredoxin family protein [Bacteroidota bacterium]